MRFELAVAESEDFLFLGLQGERLDASYLTHRIGRYVAAANVGKKGACHLPAHDGDAHARGRPRHPLHRAHARPRQPRVDADYTRVSIRMLKAVHEASPPAARMRGDKLAKTSPDGDSGDAAELISLLAAEEGDEDAEDQSGDDVAR